MKPGERVRLIKESVGVLLSIPWPEAQLTLDQFGFETYEASGYEVDEHAYFVRQLKEGTDDALLAIHAYLEGEAVAPARRAEDSPWASEPLRVFLSHIHEHRAFVGAMKRLLSSRFGIDGFVAHDDIQPSKQWREVIKAALSTCHAFVAFLHPGFHKSQWCDQEAGWALGRGIPIITARPANSERRDGFLEEHQDIRLVQDRVADHAVSAQILEVLVADPRTKAVGVKALAEAFVNSYSFDATRRWYELLAAQDSLEPEQLRRLEYAVQTNDQVYKAVYGRPPSTRSIPDLVTALVRRHDPLAASAPTHMDEPF